MKKKKIYENSSEIQFVSTVFLCLQMLFSFF